MSYHVTNTRQFRVLCPVTLEPGDDAPTNTADDKELYCPPCYGQKPHYPAENNLFKCRNCGRERKDVKWE